MIIFIAILVLVIAALVIRGLLARDPYRPLTGPEFAARFPDIAAMDRIQSGNPTMYDEVNETC